MTGNYRRTASDRMVSGLSWLTMKVGLAIGSSLARLLTFWMERKAGARAGRPARDVLFLPYYARENVGFTGRFGLLEREFSRMGLRTAVHFVPGDGPQGSLGPYWAWYLRYLRGFWGRLAAVVRARNFRAVYVQRGTFPYYTDQSEDTLLRLVRAINPNVVLDFYDADYESNRAVVIDAARHATRLTVVNDHLKSWFSDHNGDVHVVPMAVDPDRYPVKERFDLSGPVRLFWWGSVTNSRHLSLAAPAIRRLARDLRLTLVVVCPEKPDLDVDVEWHRWSLPEAAELLKGADIAISPMGDSERARGGMAYKVLEYFGASLPTVATPIAMSPYAVPGVHYLPARDEEEWYQALRALIGSEEKRREIGTAGRALVRKEHSPEAYAARARAVLMLETPDGRASNQPEIQGLRVAYLSYDGALDPLGATQVVPYLEGLAQCGVRFDLITFEKAAQFGDIRRRTAMAARLEGAGIHWHPLTYHKSPRVPATLYDVARGAIALRRLARVGKFDAFHCRGDIAPLVVRLAGLEGPLLLDMRGFFSDERVDAGSWRAGSVLDRAVRWAERGNLHRAKSIVVLTERGREVLKSRGIDHPIAVIPTAVDCEQFRRSAPRGIPEYDLVYFGSLGGWYMTQTMVDFVAEVRRSGQKIRVLFLTNNADEAMRSRLRGADIAVETCAPEDVPKWLERCRAAFFFIRATPSKIASCPTKLAEALAMGLPVLTGPGVGDVDQLVRDGRVGVVLSDYSAASYTRGWAELTDLLNDPETADRCRAFAEKRLSLVGATKMYKAVYERLVGGEP